MLSKAKILGQIFSGKMIPRLLFSFLDLTEVHTAIDPMCGTGDMFSPLSGHHISAYGIEIDPEIAKTASERFPESTIITGNAFDPKTLSGLNHANGFDLAVTNPPFVRRELLNHEKSGGFHVTHDIIRSNLISILEKAQYISAGEKKLIKNTIENISNYADLSIFSWILCIIMLKRDGKLALVVPTSWMNREYSTPLANLMEKLFVTDYIIVDSNRRWFGNDAQVQTSLVIAHRKRTENDNSSHQVKYVNLFKEAASENSLIGNIPAEINLKKSIDSLTSLPPYFEVRSITQSSLLRKKANGISEKSRLSLLTAGMSCDFTSVQDLHIHVAQGLRTGANNFFYLTRVGNQCFSSIYKNPIEFSDEIFAPIIRNQKALSDTYSLQEVPEDLLLNIQNTARRKDLDNIDCIDKTYKPLNKDIESYITFSETYRHNGKPIPELSAVKTNVKPGNKDQLPRFWYMIPKPGERHSARLFIPRVNNNYPICRINCCSGNILIDANFNSIRPDAECKLTEHAILALFNSRWTLIQFEECGSVMGGGALKLDAVQIKKCVFPTDISKYGNELDLLGKRLCKHPIHSATGITDLIDKIIVRALGIEENPAINFLQSTLEKYLSCRR